MLQPCKLSKISPIKDTSIAASGDFISKLPDEILCSIMSNVTLRDSVRTSVLSHRWHRVSSSLPVLIFDWFNITGDEFSGAHEHPCLSYQEKFVSAVNQYLEFYTGTSLHSFKVSFCLSRALAFDIDQWIRFAIRMGVEHLSLKLYCETCRYGTLRHSIRQEVVKQNYILRSNLLEDEKSKLKHLHLVGCRMGRNFTTQFGFLETLTFGHSPLALYDLHNMFYYLVKLKHLELRSCTLPMKLSLGSLLLLQSFSIGSCDGIKEIEFSNAELSFFQCICHEMIQFNANGVPNLKKLTYFMHSNEVLQIFNRVPSQLHMLGALTVYSKTDWVKNVPENITTYSNVTRLKLVLKRQLKFDILKMISILKAFPCMRRLILVISCPEDDEQRKLQQPSEYVHKYLEYVEIGGFYGTPSQIEFAEYLLRHTSSLKQLVIKQEVKKYHEKRQSWNEGERQVVYEQLMGLSKARILENLVTVFHCIPAAIPGNESNPSCQSNGLINTMIIRPKQSLHIFCVSANLR